MFEMNFLTIYILLGFFILPSASQECKPFTFTSGLIINGEDTARGEFPFLVALVNLQFKRFFCGANLISQRHALTAAHCLFQKDHTQAIDKDDFVALLGKYNMKNPYETDVTVKAMQEMVIHEDWKPHVWRFDADIAILIFNSEVQLSKYIKTVCLPSSKTEELKEGVVVGWGVSERTGNQQTEDTPRKIKMKRPPTNENCFINEGELANLSSNRTFCGEGDKSGPCLGDSGGGFYVNSNFIWKIQGIVSASLVNSHGECNISKLSVFTNVAHYIDWINKNSNRNDTIYPIPKNDETTGSYHPIEMNCQFQITDYDYPNHQYTCRLQNEITDDNLIFKTVTGSHVPGKDIRDVQLLTFSHSIDTKSNTKYIPSGISDVLPNIQEFDINNAMLTKLFRRNFKGMSTVEVIGLPNNFIEYIEEDTFYEVPKLRVLSISRNALTTIPFKLFMHSTELKFIDLSKNYIKEFYGESLSNCPLLESIILEGNLLKKLKVNFSNFSKINLVNLSDNVCVNAFFSINNYRDEATTLNDLQNYIDTNC